MHPLPAVYSRKNILISITAFLTNFYICLTAFRTPFYIINTAYKQCICLFWYILSVILVYLSEWIMLHICDILYCWKEVAYIWILIFGICSIIIWKNDAIVTSIRMQCRMLIIWKPLGRNRNCAPSMKVLILSDDQRKVILNWIDAITAQNDAYTAVVFRMAMQCCFVLLLELADLKWKDHTKGW